MTFRLVRWYLMWGCVVCVLTNSSPAAALDAHQDRRGFFGGVGLGGGGVFSGSEPGGGILFDFQLGGGATRQLTLCLDTDLWIHVLEKNRNMLLTPGPEINYYFGDTGVFVRVGVGVALTFSWYESAYFEVPPGGKKPDNNDFRVGFDGSLGVGWEFFVGSNFALGIAVEADYVVLSGDDIASIGFSLGLRHY